MKRFVTFEEATVEYTKMTCEIPTFDKMCKLYHQYRNTLKEYKWKTFTEFIEWNE